MQTVKDDSALIRDSIAILNNAGHYVEWGDFPGFFVDGKEVDAGQLLGLALQERELQVGYG